MHHDSLNRSLRGFARARLRTRRSRVTTFLAAGSALIAGPYVASLTVSGFSHDVQTLPTIMVEAAQSAAVQAKVASGRHLGFDTSVYPGDVTMAAWRKDAPYEWVGYYLPAPCHKDDSWAGKRATLASMNWGTAVIYVGQQTWGKTPGAPERRVVKSKAKGKRAKTKVVSAPARVSGSCDADLVGAKRGVVDAEDAVAKTAAEGFPTGTVVFLDVEYMDKVPKAMQDYYVAWTQRVLADGRYRPGFYAHTHNAARIYADVRSVYAAAGVTTDPPFWIAGSHDFSPDQSAPSDVGHAFAAAWQGILDRAVSHGGITLPIDVSVAAVSSPSDALASSE
jgi:hypothetical protein